jgi:hypothetical protein
VRRAGEDLPFGASRVSYGFRSYYHVLLLPLAATNRDLPVKEGVIGGLAQQGLAEALAAGARDALSDEPRWNGVD